jgi:hypothetical protein
LDIGPALLLDAKLPRDIRVLFQSPFIDRMRLRFKDLDLTDPARASEFELYIDTMMADL